MGNIVMKRGRIAKIGFVPAGVEHPDPRYI
jgi:hypothetical protein